MSRRDIETVCTLAAHLAQVQHSVDTGIGTFQEFIRPAERCAADAMLLQKLGRRARNNNTRNPRHGPGVWDGAFTAWCAENQRIHDAAALILGPYGLKASTTNPEYSLRIVGLPGNALGGNTDGFEI